MPATAVAERTVDPPACVPGPPRPDRRRPPHVSARAVLAAILLGAALLRFYRFPAVPAGFNQDEASAGYETFSLIAHGTDRWGNHLPVYFPGWGSGQNVLLSYLDIPFVALLGPTPFAVRLLPAILGVRADLRVDTGTAALRVRLFYNRAGPRDFQQNVDIFVRNGSYVVTRYRAYYFYESAGGLVSARSYVAIVQRAEKHCPGAQPLARAGVFDVIRCVPTAKPATP